MTTILKEDSGGSAMAVVLAILLIAGFGFVIYMFAGNPSTTPKLEHTTINMPAPVAPSMPSVPTPAGGE